MAPRPDLTFPSLHTTHDTRGGLRVIGLAAAALTMLCITTSMVRAGGGETIPPGPAKPPAVQDDPNPFEVSKEIAKNREALRACEKTAYGIASQMDVYRGSLRSIEADLQTATDKAEIRELRKRSRSLKQTLRKMRRSHFERQRACEILEEKLANLQSID